MPTFTMRSSCCITHKINSERSPSSAERLRNAHVMKVRTRIRFRYHDISSVLRKVTSYTKLMMRAVSISFVETAALVHAEKHFPMKTPMRWQLIAEYVLKCIPVLSGKLGASPDIAASIPLMVLGNASSSTTARFQPTSEMCRNAFSIISSSHPELLCYAQHQASYFYLMCYTVVRNLFISSKRWI